MKRIHFSLLIALLVGFWAGAAPALAEHPVHTGTPSIAVLEFDEPENGLPPSGLGAVVADEFMFAVQSSQYFSLASMDRVFAAQAELGVMPGGHCRAARKVGQMVGADAALCGMVTQFGQQARIDAYLIDVESGRTLWSESTFSSLDQAGFMSTAGLFLSEMEVAAALNQADPEPEPEQEPDVTAMEQDPDRPETVQEPEPVEEDAEPETAGPETAEPETAGPELAEGEPQETEPDTASPSQWPDSDGLGQGNATQGEVVGPEGNGTETAALDPIPGYESEAFPADLQQQQEEEQERMDRERALLELDFPFEGPPGNQDLDGPMAMADFDRVIEECEAGLTAKAMLDELEADLLAELLTLPRESVEDEAAYAEAQELAQATYAAEQERIRSDILARFAQVKEEFRLAHGYAAIVEPDQVGNSVVPDVTEDLIQAMDEQGISVEPRQTPDFLPTLALEETLWHAALAVSESTGNIGLSNDQADQMSAVTSALAACGEDDCRVVQTSVGGCIALAGDGRSLWSSAEGSDLGGAIAEAYAGCGQDLDQCRIWGSVCTRDVAGYPEAWTEFTWQGVTVAAPQDWEIRENSPQALVLGGRMQGNDPELTFGVGLEDAPLTAQDVGDRYDLAVDSLGSVTVDGLEAEVLGANGRTFLRMVSIGDPMPDGRYLGVVFALSGEQDPLVDLPVFEQVLAGLRVDPQGFQ